MPKLLFYVGSVVMGLVICSVGYLKTTSSYFVDISPQIQLCEITSAPNVPATKVTKSGLPLSSSVREKTLIWNCGGLAPKIALPNENTPSALDILKPFLKTWQFYVNWAIWSLPLLGISYLFNKSHENIRD